MPDHPIQDRGAPQADQERRDPPPTDDEPGEPLGDRAAHPGIDVLPSVGATSGTVGFCLTLFRKADGIMTKRIAPGPDGKPVADGSACAMARGEARRLTMETDQPATE